MATVTISDVWKYYGKTMAVKELNLEIKNNEFMCILGPSGCGKSSTLRMLAGLEFISSGDIYFDDVRVNDLPPRDRDIAMVFENYALYPHKTVYENMANPLKLRRTPKDEIERRVRRAAEILEIDPLLGRKPVELSGGQKQRTAIGRAIVREPKVFLFDEPIAHLDAKLRSHMRGELKHLQRDLETTTVYVTHDQLEGMSMADRIAVMHEGVLQQLGTPEEIYNQPANEFVAGFVGEPPMNFLDCTLERTNVGLTVVHSGFRLALSEQQASLLSASGSGHRGAHRHPPGQSGHRVRRRGHARRAGRDLRDRAARRRHDRRSHHRQRPGHGEDQDRAPWEGPAIPAASASMWTSCTSST